MITYTEKPWLKCYEDEVPTKLDYPDISVHEWLEEAAATYPDSTAIIFQGRKITYRELNELADTVASGLVANGFNKGDRAVIYMANTPQFVAIYYGILKAGGIVIATNPLYSERELQHQLHDCGAETVFVMSRYYQPLKNVQSRGETNVKRIIVTHIKTYLPFIKRLLYGMFMEKKSGFVSK